MTLKSSHPLKYSVHTRLREFHLKRFLPRSSKGRFLDVGCGLGYLTEMLGKGFFTVGVDCDMKAIIFNRERGLINMVLSKTDNLPFKEQTLDLITCSEVLEHLPDKVDEQSLVEMARLLKPGGRLLITVPSLEGIRAKSKLRNLGHDFPRGGEYHYRIGYSWHKFNEMIKRIPMLRLVKKRYSMYLFSELFMDVIKWIYFKKHALKEHSDMMGVKDTFLFRVYRCFFPLIYLFIIFEDILIATFFKGHILILVLERQKHENSPY